MKKRRIFAIDLPDEDFDAPMAAPSDPPETFPAGKVAEKTADKTPGKTPAPEPASAAPEAPRRRSPMASAISENAEALRERKALESQIRAENDALARDYVRMKQLGLIIDLVPLDQIETYKLVRDRQKGDDQELLELISSIRDLGLSNPIRLEPRADGRYELIQGYRRLSAYRALLEETGDRAAWGAIPAGILPRGEETENLYRRMVDENMVRKDISFAEMALLAIHYAGDPGTQEIDPDRAVATLFASAGYQKRSYIRQFIRLMKRLGEDLRFPQHLPRALGLKLLLAIEDRPELVAQIRGALRGADNRSVSYELEVLRKAAGGEEGDLEASQPATKAAAKAAKSQGGEMRLQLSALEGPVTCLARNGSLEIRLARDFAALPRAQLEQALQKLLADLQ